MNCFELYRFGRSVKGGIGRALMYTPSYRVAYSQVNMFPVFRNDYDRTIAETEHAYSKILESSQTLLTVLKKESQTLGHGQGRPM